MRKFEHLMLGRQSKMYSKIMRNVEDRVRAAEQLSGPALSRISDHSDRGRGLSALGTPRRLDLAVESAGRRKERLRLGAIDP